MTNPPKQIRLRLTRAEDKLLQRAAKQATSTPSELVRRLLSHAIADRKTEYQLPVGVGKRVIERSIRVVFTEEEMQVQRQIGHGLPLSAWARYVVLDSLRGVT